MTELEKIKRERELLQAIGALQAKFAQSLDELVGLYQAYEALTGKSVGLEMCRHRLHDAIDAQWAAAHWRQSTDARAPATAKGNRWLTH